MKFCSLSVLGEQQQQQWQKRFLKSVFKLFQNIIHRSHSKSLLSINVNEFSWSWILKDCIVSNFKKRILENRCLAFIFSTKRKIRQFYVVVILWQQRNAQKSVIEVQSCCFANLLFCRFCLSSLLLQAMIDALQWQVKTYNMIAVFLLLRPVSLVFRSLEVL